MDLTVRTSDGQTALMQALFPPNPEINPPDPCVQTLLLSKLPEVAINVVSGPWSALKKLLQIFHKLSDQTKELFIAAGEFNYEAPRL